MILFIKFIVYLLIIIAFSQDYFGVLSVHSTGGEKGGVDYLPNWLILSKYNDNYEFNEK